MKKIFIENSASYFYVSRRCKNIEILNCPNFLGIAPDHLDNGQGIIYVDSPIL